MTIQHGLSQLPRLLDLLYLVLQVPGDPIPSFARHTRVKPARRVIVRRLGDVFSSRACVRPCLARESGGQLPPSIRRSPGRP